MRKTSLPIGVVVWLAIAGFPPAAGAQAPRRPAPGAGTAAVSPAPDGAELFAMTCQVCHGQAGIGGVGPALRGAKFTSDFVRKVLQDGRPGTMMPGFTATMSATEIAGIARYVVRLQSPDGPAPGGLRGDPVAGEAVFFSQGSARSCSVCHAVEGRGGSVGPDLMAKVARQSPKQIFQKIIVVPHRSADRAYQTVRLTTKTGSVLTGIKSGETPAAVFFYDTSSLPPVLRTIPKGDIAASALHHESVMPNDYASRLTLQQLLDVVAFLKRAGGDRASPVTLADVAN
jgi:putative heme-binding domain-containing protein